MHVLEEGPGDRVVRRMTIGGKITVLEEITWDKTTWTVDFRLLEHPSHSGNVINRVDIKQSEESDEQEYWLTYEMRWKYEGEGEDPLAGMKMNGAVESSIKVIEKAEETKKA